jgi:3-phenylpropionate/trans-cinnamate dioxygenase ferredoxin component
MEQGFVYAVNAADVPDDEPLGVEIDGRQVAIYRIDGEYFATENVCPHQYALMSEGYLEDGCIECPLHQARFDVRTGAAQCGPVDRGLRVYRVALEAGAVLVELGDAA